MSVLYLKMLPWSVSTQDSSSSPYMWLERLWFTFLDCFCCEHLKRIETLSAVNTLLLCALTHLPKSTAPTNLFPPVVMIVLMFPLLPLIIPACLLPRQPVSPALRPLFSTLAPIFSYNGHEDVTKTLTANIHGQGIFYLVL